MSWLDFAIPTSVCKPVIDVDYDTIASQGYSIDVVILLG